LLTITDQGDLLPAVVPMLGYRRDESWKRDVFAYSDVVQFSSSNAELRSSAATTSSVTASCSPPAALS